MEYIGNMQSEAEQFSKIDEAVVSRLESIYDSIKTINDNWNDPKSNEYLSQLINHSNSLRDAVDEAHKTMNGNYEIIQSALDVYGKDSHAELPELRELPPPAISESRTSGFLFNPTPVGTALETLSTLATSLSRECMNFTIDMSTSFPDQSDDPLGIIPKIKGALERCAQSYTGLSPYIALISGSAAQIKQLYDEKMQGVADAVSAAGSN